MVIGPFEPFALMSTCGGGRLPLTLITTESETEVNPLLQVAVYVLEFVRGPVEREPDVLTEPMPLFIMQVFALLDVQVILTLVPELIVRGPSEPFPLILTVGEGDKTFTVTESDTEVPAEFWQVAVYVTDEVSLPVVRVPEVPLYPGGVTLQYVALADVHFTVTEVLYGIVIGPLEPFTLRLTDGAGVAP